MLSLELPGRLDPDVRDRILAEARGNPLVIRQAWLPLCSPVEVELEVEVRV